MYEKNKFWVLILIGITLTLASIGYIGFIEDAKLNILLIFVLLGLFGIALIYIGIKNLVPVEKMDEKTKEAMLVNQKYQKLLKLYETDDFGPVFLDRQDALEFFDRLNDISKEKSTQVKLQGILRNKLGECVSQIKAGNESQSLQFFDAATKIFRDLMQNYEMGPEEWDSIKNKFFDVQKLLIDEEENEEENAEGKKDAESEQDVKEEIKEKVKEDAKKDKDVKGKSTKKKSG